jgi:hypothetical protein
MKKMRLFGLLMAVIMGVSFTSCEEDEANISITIDSTTPIPTNVVAGETISFKFVVVSDNNIEEIRFKENYNVLPNGSITEFTAKKSHNGIFGFQTTTATTLKFAIEVEDSKGNIEAYPFDVVVAPAPGDINTYTAVLLGNQSSNTGSFYSTSTNEVFQLAQSEDNAAKIDFVYLLDDTKHVMAAPNDAFVPTKYAGVADWTPRNATKFKITLLSTAEFDGIINDAKITEQSNVELSIVSELAADDVVAFTTAQGKKGLFKIETIANNTMTIKVKVQE